MIFLTFIRSSQVRFDNISPNLTRTHQFFIRRIHIYKYRRILLFIDTINKNSRLGLNQFIIPPSRGACDPTLMCCHSYTQNFVSTNMPNYIEKKKLLQNIKKHIFKVTKIERKNKYFFRIIIILPGYVIFQHITRDVQFEIINREKTTYIKLRTSSALQTV